MIEPRKPLKLNELYRELSSEPNSPLGFIANVIYTNYNSSRKKMLQGLYNIVNGGPRHYWAPCEVSFAPFSLDTIIATNVELKDISWQGQKDFFQDSEIDPEGSRRLREIDIENLPYYA